MSKEGEYQYTEKHFKEINITVLNKGYYLKRFFEDSELGPSSLSSNKAYLWVLLEVLNIKIAILFSSVF